MIVTRTWLEELIDLQGIDDDTLYRTFNSIGLEVDSMRRYAIPSGVVVGKVLSCEKHPDADKLNLCQVDVGEAEPLQIVCGAANVRDAEYVAVATVGAVLPGDFEIKPAKLRGVESFGMICSSAELGLPETEKGIMILDESLGEMVPGRELAEYPLLNDTVIELELTANRGDCLSIRGVARDLSAALERPLKTPDYTPRSRSKKGIARFLELHTKGEFPGRILLTLAEGEAVRDTARIRLRLALVDEMREDPLDRILAYAIHESGVILRAFDAEKLHGEGEKIRLDFVAQGDGYAELRSGDTLLCIPGVRQEDPLRASAQSREILFVASYLDPDILVPCVAERGLKTDPLYYRSSRGSDPDLEWGLERLQAACDDGGECRFNESTLSAGTPPAKRTVSLKLEQLDAIIGQHIPKSTVFSILKRLGFEIHQSGNAVGLGIPPWRHDIRNDQDVAEEVLRIVGINRIEACPLTLVEADRMTPTARAYRIARDLRERAVAAGFFEAVTYAFADREIQRRFDFPVLDESVELVNPIVEELNTLRSTLTLNLLDAARRNMSYGKRSIPLFEIGSVFDCNRTERRMVTFLHSGEAEPPSILNQGKPPRIDFPRFVRALSEVLGPLELRPCTEKNGLVHPYLSADCHLGEKRVGWLSKVHPEAAAAFDLEDTFVAEFDFEALIPPHKNASAISNYQGTWKDLSLLVDKEIPYGVFDRALGELEEPLLRRHFPIDVYESEELGDRKSLTIRFFLQSEEGTLSDEAIEGAMERILRHLEKRCGAKLR